MDTAQQTNNKKDRTAVWAITSNGVKPAKRLVKKLDNAILFLSKRMAGHLEPSTNETIFENLKQEIGKHFHSFSAHIFIFSTGIAVRMIAPHLNSKITDPAVVVVDDKGEYAISLLSGHIGGANSLAKQTAQIIDARPVITTATDTNELPSIDMIAEKAGHYIETPENIKRINMAFLENKKIKLNDPFNLIKPFIPEQFLLSDYKGVENFENILCSHLTVSVSCETFIVRPRILSVGVGCNRGTSFEIIKSFLEEAFEKQGFSQKSIARLGTTEVKKDETGLLDLGNWIGLDFDFYSKEELNSVTEIPTPSKIVEKHLGVKSVSEAAAILSARKMIQSKEMTDRKIKLILPKQKNKDVTISVAMIT